MTMDCNWDIDGAGRRSGRIASRWATDGKEIGFSMGLLGDEDGGGCSSRGDERGAKGKEGFFICRRCFNQNVAGGLAGQNVEGVIAQHSAKRCKHPLITTYPHSIRPDHANISRY